MATLYKNEFGRKHLWVTVVNPLNHRALLKACDGCGVVKSENSMARSCHATTDKGLISGALEVSVLAS